MDAVKFLKEKKRMSNDCTITCWVCPLSQSNNDVDASCDMLLRDHPDKAVEIVEKWSEENPVKSCYDVMIEMFPNIDFDNIDCIDRFSGTDTDCNDGRNCAECWKAQEYIKPTTTTK
jgi:hypothetical protein